MVYIFKEYKHIFDTPMKMEQESVVVSKIMDLLNKNKYDNIYDFINKNQTYQDFLKNNELENVVKHFGNTLNEQDFKDIQSAIVKLTEQKKDFDRKNIKTTIINDKEYNSYQGLDKTYFLDNSHSSMSLERQMEELQPTQQEFQTSDIKQNTENMMKELEENKKESLNLKYLNEIDFNLLNDKQKQTYSIMKDYQLNKTEPVRVDIDREIIVDELNNIMRIERNNGEIAIIGDDNTKNVLNNTEEKQETKTFQKTLSINPSTIYSNNN